jgi:hypothetical protein
MLADTQTLSTDCATDVDTNTSVYVRRFGDSQKSEFSVAGLSLPSEMLLTVSHDTGKSGEQRKMVRHDRTVANALNLPVTGSVYIVWVRPQDVAITDTMMLQDTNKLVDFLIEGGANANVTKVLNSEV